MENWTEHYPALKRSFVESGACFINYLQRKGSTWSLLPVFTQL